MARPKTEGLEYFPKDTGSFSDRKIRRLMKEFGCKGYVIYDYLRCVIYEDRGYYVAYDDGLAFDIADFLGDGISENLVNEVVKGCLRNDLFDFKLFDTYLILTSNGIQKRYLNIKKGGVIDEKYRVIAEESDEITENDQLIPQRKEKETKEKKSKEKHIPPEDEFLEYCKNQIPETYEGLKFSLSAKYKTWVEDGWKDGYGNEIKNWKTKILNTIPHLKEKSFDKNGKQSTNFSDAARAYVAKSAGTVRSAG